MNSEVRKVWCVARSGSFWRYVMTGGMAAVVDLGLFLLLVMWGFPVLAASVLSFLVAMIMNFLLSSMFAFRTGIQLRRFVPFVLVALIGLSLNTGVTVLCVSQDLAPAFAKISGIGVAFIFNYMANLWLVFRANKVS